MTTQMKKDTTWKAIIIGATGATGRELLAQLLAHPPCTQVDIFVRRAPTFQHEKLRVHIVDFMQPETWASEVQGDILFSCLGTTLKDMGSKEAQWRIDYQLVLDFACAARQNGVDKMVLVSAAGANAASRIFYSRMKGALENAIATLGFSSLWIFRPPLLLRPDSRRPMEIWSARLLHGLNAMGFMKNQRPLPVAQLAQAMIAAVEESPEIPAIFEAKDIRALLGE